MVHIKRDNLQDPYLNDLRKRRQTVVIYLTNGVKQTGIIESFDQHVISLLQGRSAQLIYKHTIASVMPATKALPAVTRAAPSAPAITDRSPPQTTPVISRKAPRRTFTREE